ncbi:MAG: tRNA (adenosine(37)-N6)-threonylcarbamoyltransferase complex ATPase subunit type 1 TsaE [Acidimicrobiia bacterium]|nr:tRNA (adenosine(37)-N6)-threonylcarbamoyltransferase complex ATPase subunit type 1 TsaE [Acidimicrobiia bacterium]
MILLHTTSVDATRDLAAAVAELVRGGDLIVLAGDLGAGKTAFTQGFGRALGVEGPITSPTYTLAHQYDDGRLRLHHLDVYRFDATAEVLDVGLAELLDDPDAVTLIEWGDAILSSLPADLLEVRLVLGGDDDDRDVTIRMVGPRWAARQRALTAALSPWMVAESPTAGGH